MSNGFIHIYTGRGKGKTTAAIGLALRAKSRGLRVLFMQFMKGSAESGEIGILKKISIATKKFSKIRSPLFYPDTDKMELRKETVKAISQIKKIMQNDKFDMIILDEFNCLLSRGILTESAAIELISKKPARLELVLTGRGATRRLIAVADYVTEMKVIKHPFAKGAKARKGIEY